MLRLSRLLSGAYLLLALVMTGLTLFVGPVGSALVPLPQLGAAGEPVTITIAYGTEKRAWLEEAARRFAATNPRVGGRAVRVKLEGIGSREMVTRIVQGGYQPTVVSPASAIQLALLREEWRARSGGEILRSGDDEARPLVLTPLVLVMWEQRARALWPNGQNDFWNRIHDALTNSQGWKGLGGDERWGLVKFGHTSPETSNSGLQTLLLLAYAFHNKASGLSAADVADPAFQRWLDEIEGAVNTFGDSTGSFMSEMVLKGPSAYDLAAVYENLALENIEQAKSRQGQTLRLYYPPATIFSDHPYAILNAPWVTTAQRDAAAQFRAFLLSREMQELARQYGFRPADPAVSISSNDANNPFVKYRDYGVVLDVSNTVATPSVDVINQILELWRSKGYDR